MSTHATLAAAVGVGLLGAIVMDLPMRYSREGMTPAYVVTAALRRADPDEVARRDALLVHHVAGAVGGLVFGVLFVLLEPHVTEPGFDVFAAAGVVTGVLYNGFAYLALPRSGIDRDRFDAIRQSWAAATLVYGLTLLTVFPLLV